MRCGTGTGLYFARISNSSVLGSHTSTTIGVFFYLLYNTNMKNKRCEKIINEKRGVMTENIEITSEIKHALDLMENTNKHIFLTGKAGTGKSTLLRYFCDTTEKNIVVLAPTGVAALNIEGATIHSFFQFNFGIMEEKSIQFLYKKREVFKNLDAIVIDEISMVRADMMNAIDLFINANICAISSFSWPIQFMKTIFFCNLQMFL